MPRSHCVDDAIEVYSKKRSALAKMLGYRAVTEARCDFSSASRPGVMHMRSDTREKARLVNVLSVLTLLCTSAGATDIAGAQIYQVQTELGMPHLEENLRYATTHERRCLTQEQLERLFPALDYPSLAGCHLVDKKREGDTVSFALACAAGHGTTGNVVWKMGHYKATGTLNVKLGGKNMTFFERVTARPLGTCAASPGGLDR
jgi:hypothetical protein